MDIKKRQNRSDHESRDDTCSPAIWKSISKRINFFITGEKEKPSFSYGNTAGSFRSGRPFSRTVSCAGGTAFIQQSTCKSVWSRSVEPVSNAFVHICHTRPPLLMLPPVNTMEGVKKVMAKQNAQCRP